MRLQVQVEIHHLETLSFSVLRNTDILAFSLGFEIQLGLNLVGWAFKFLSQCSKWLPVRQSEADNFGGGAGTF